MTKESYHRADWKTIDVDFLTSYYAQDGNNGAVTGGIGTEQLTDFTQKISLKIPMNQKLTMSSSVAYDYYSSASTDNIDNIRSSDSSSDVRGQLSIGVDFKIKDKESVGLNIGTSIEYDYNSLHAGISYSKILSSGNTGISLQLQGFKDDWLIIYPIELRRTASVHTDKRNVFNGSVTLTQVINKKFQIALMAEATSMQGLLSTPFHRVYFSNEPTARIEQLPKKRLKIPLAMRANAVLSDRILLRSYYRYYFDDWGMQAHTASVELPIKLNRFFAIYPSYRYHIQSAVDYFAPYGVHRGDELFYTSDYDVSALSSHTVGIGLLYSPAGGITQFKLPFIKPELKIEGISLRIAQFYRSTGLRSSIISAGLSMKI